jgi:hypothetical protein
MGGGTLSRLPSSGSNATAIGAKLAASGVCAGTYPKPIRTPLVAATTELMVTADRLRRLMQESRYQRYRNEYVLKGPCPVVVANLLGDKGGTTLVEHFRRC